MGDWAWHTVTIHSVLAAMIVVVDDVLVPI